MEGCPPSQCSFVGPGMFVPLTQCVFRDISLKCYFSALMVLFSSYSGPFFLLCKNPSFSEVLASKSSLYWAMNSSSSALFPKDREPNHTSSCLCGFIGAFSLWGCRCWFLITSWTPVTSGPVLPSPAVDVYTEMIHFFLLLTVSDIQCSGLGTCCLVMNPLGTVWDHFLPRNPCQHASGAEFRCFRSQIKAQNHTK